MQQLRSTPREHEKTPADRRTSIRRHLSMTLYLAVHSVPAKTEGTEPRIEPHKTLKTLCAFTDRLLGSMQDDRCSRAMLLPSHRSIVRLRALLS